jgi:endogenous inhibitor of DNA gyrase (YacG/DUF329 family)
MKGGVVRNIQTPCPACGGEAQLDPAHVALLPGWATVSAHYAFVCPRCRTPVVKQAKDKAVDLLHTAGVSVVGAPEHVPHPEAPRSGAPFTPDDLIDFHFSLAFEGWFARLAGGR